MYKITAKKNGKTTTELTSSLRLARLWLQLFKRNGYKILDAPDEAKAKANV